MHLHEEVCTSKKVDQISFQSRKCVNVTSAFSEPENLFVIVARDKKGTSCKCLLSACVLTRTGLDMN